MYILARQHLLKTYDAIMRFASHDVDHIKKQHIKVYIMNTVNKLIRIKKVQEITGLSKSYIYQLVKQGAFPRSILLIEGGSAVAWLNSEVIEWVESRVQARDEGVA